MICSCNEMIFIYCECGAHPERDTIGVARPEYDPLQNDFTEF